MTFDAAIFDLDGTLQDSEIHWVYATRDFIRDNGVPVTDGQATALVYGRSAIDIYSDVASLPPFHGKSLAYIADRIRTYYTERMKTVDIAFPTSVALFRRLAADMPVAIVSGSPKHDVEAAAVALGLSDVCSLVIGAEDCERGKPDPEGFLKAAAHFGADPTRCIVFEDSRAGVLAAKAAGMYCVAISREGRPPQDVSAADVVVADLGEFRYP